MRRSPSSHLSVAIAISVLVGGCALGTPVARLPTKTGPVSLAFKLKKVDALTKTFSLAQNEGLSQAATALSKNTGLLTALASLQSLATSLAGTGMRTLPSIRASQAYRIDACRKWRHRDLRRRDQRSDRDENSRCGAGL
jgi:hypothetical protein